mmetsp:Transcript_58446/g.71470  ORF Transcript_58446/g.71470 Transcript_58446/m.71470 type:complete len:211 (+) Transcript_58446:129-761(+)
MLRTACGFWVTLGGSPTLRCHIQGRIAHCADGLHYCQRVHNGRVSYRLGDRLPASPLLVFPRGFSSLCCLVRELRRRLGVTGSLLCGLASFFKKGHIVLTITSFAFRVLVFLFILSFLGICFSLLLLSMIFLRFGCFLTVTVTEAPVLGSFFISPTSPTLLHDLFIGIGQFLKVFLVATFVWVALHGNELVGLLDFRVCGTGGHAQNRIG